MKNYRPTLKKNIETGRFSIPLRIYGDTGPHLVCVNGVQQSMAMWRSFVTRFSCEYQIALFDFPGRGKARFPVIAPTGDFDTASGGIL